MPGILPDLPGLQGGNLDSKGVDSIALSQPRCQPSSSLTSFARGPSAMSDPRAARMILGGLLRRERGACSDHFLLVETLLSIRSTSKVYEGGGVSALEASLRAAARRARCRADLTRASNSL